MPSRSSRWRLAALIAAMLGVASALLLGISGTVDPRGSALAGAAHRVNADAKHVNGTTLTLLRRSVVFTGPDQPLTAPPAMPAAAGILVDVDSGRILWDLNPHQPLPPASTIKMLTALVALENFSPDLVITATPDALNQAGDESKMGLHAGYRLTVAQLLSGMLMVSGNDAASVLATDTVGMHAFVDAMNAQLAALDLHDSRVTSPVGLDNPAMRASAYDLAAIATVDVESFPLFQSIVRSKYESITAAPDHPAFQLYNVNQLLSMYPGAAGIKPGWTGDAGACEVGMAERDGHRLISVLLNGHLVYTETKHLLDWGFQQEQLQAQRADPPVGATS